MDDKQIQGIEAQLNTIIRLLAAPIVQDRPIAEAAPMLADLGMDTRQIAMMCNTTSNVVRTALLRAGAKKTRTRRSG